MRHRELTEAQQRRRSLLIVVRGLLAGVVLIGFYFAVPLDRDVDSGAGLLIGGLVVIMGVVAWQVRAIMGSRYPRLRAAEALATAVPLLLVVFSSVYILLAEAQPHSFNTSLDKVGAIYFTITVFATVGFGDIIPVTSTARVLVSIQMLFDLAVLGILAKVILGAVQVGLQRRDKPPESLLDAAETLPPTESTDAVDAPDPAQHPG